ncbi:hypothetical protein KKF34_19290 [Myxococcota bacterium]|nr:hypothetical protein [Myxococcota bacterium]MBU1382203.1 hypothetical protein [Myxococcota bacterium]MBU1499033.1 hypothetical protein [Myxococcota bacterium]
MSKIIKSLSISFIFICLASFCSNEKNPGDKKTPVVKAKPEVAGDIKTDKIAVNKTDKKLPTAEKPPLKPVSATKVPAAEVKKILQKTPEEIDREYWEKADGPLDKKYHEIFSSIKAQETGAKPKENYYISNEDYYSLWYPHIVNKKGAYIGVASDQNYSLAVTSGAKVVFLVDYDKEVNNTHRLYSLLVEISSTPDELMKWFNIKNFKKVWKLAVEKYGKKRGERVALLHKYQGKHVITHHRSRRYMVKKGMAGNYWLADQKMFDAWKKLVIEKRVFILPGNLKDGKTITEIGNALNKVHLPVRTIYMSNAEEFWFYPEAFKKAFLNLPMDDSSKVLRTAVLNEKFKKGYLFHYTIQSGPDFRAWMSRPEKYFSSKTMCKYRKPEDPKKLYFTILPGPPKKI